MRLTVVVHLIGGILQVYGFTFLAPIAVAAIYGEWWDLLGFVAAGAVTLVAAALARRAEGRIPDDFRRSEGLLVVAATWMVIAALSALPYVWVGLGPLDALFEAMSGLTTTGATVFVDFSRYGRGLFFWRAMTQWLGGMGVIALFVAVLPRLAIAGREIFFAEAPGPTDEKLTPQLRKTATALWTLYVLLSAMEVVALLACGMSLYDAVCNTFTTLAAGGFSPHPESIMGYNNVAAEWVITLFMILAGANFALQYRALRGQPRSLLRDEELRAYAATIIVAGSLVAAFLWRAEMGPAAAVRHGFFQVVSILTTTGFASVDFEQWADQPKAVLLALMFIGGSAGSAAGGPKVVRHILLARYTLLELTRTLHPRAVLPVKLGGRVVPDGVMRSVVVFMLMYVLIFALSTAVVALLGEDIITALTASIATLGNIGPGFGGVGPMSNYMHLHPLSKLTLIFTMWIGRLELITVLAILQPAVWRTATWSARR
ncbi:MAG TPA: TrkH family potassium uptake protein [Vicinamibacterales bacterium]|nr:TrkH family potassium uptake protein [Vicinamibacterales bacterium]